MIGLSIRFILNLFHNLIMGMSVKLKFRVGTNTEICLMLHGNVASLRNY